MDRKYILAIDQGTTGSTALVLNFTNPKSPKIIAKHTIAFKQYYPQPGWVEHNLDNIYNSVLKSISNVIKQAQQQDTYFNTNKIISIGITNQRETLCLFYKHNATPAYNAIVWQCRRSSKICDKLKTQNLEPLIRKKTGLLLDPYFSGTKILWIMTSLKELAKTIKKNEIFLSTIDSYLIYKLTDKISFVTDYTNASRTLLFNIKTLSYDSELLDIMQVPTVSILPQITNSAGILGYTKGVGILPDGIPISSCLGDQQAALIGQCCINKGDIKCTLGTGAFILVNTGNKLIYSKNNLITTIAWGFKHKICYAIEGSIFIAGAAIQFLRDNLKFFDNSAQSEEFAKQGTGAPNIYFVPALSGLSAPYWNPYTRGAIMGLTRATSNYDICKATLEGICFQINDLMNSIKYDFRNIGQFKVDGGASQNNLLMQILSNILNLKIYRSAIIESTAYGAALFAALGIGIYSDMDELNNLNPIDTEFKPSKHFNRTIAIKGWKQAIKAVQTFQMS